MRPSADVAEVARGYASLSRPRAPQGLPGDPALGRRHRGPARRRPRPPLPGRGAAAADRLGRPRPDHPGRARRRGPPRASQQPPRDLRGRRPRAAAGEPRRLHRHPRTLPRRDGASPVRPRRVARPLQSRLTRQHDAPGNHAPDRIRTCGLVLRRDALYPAELRALARQLSDAGAKSAVVISPPWRLKWRPRRLAQVDLSAIFLGTGGSVPSARRSTASVLISRGGDRLLFDCGEGTQRQMQRSIGLTQVDEIYLTHFHADHILGLPGLLKTYDLTDRERPLAIHGPPGPAGPLRDPQADRRPAPLRARAGRAGAGRGGRA